MKKILSIFVATFVLLTSLQANSQEYGTRDEAVALVNKAIEFIGANGKEKAIEELNKSDNQFIDRDLYVMAANLEDGTRLAHPYNQNLLGKSLLGTRDIDGKPYGDEIVEVAETAGEGWVSYKFTDPVTKQIGEKETYVKKFDDMILYCGVYKR